MKKSLNLLIKPKVKYYAFYKVVEDEKVFLSDFYLNMKKPDNIELSDEIDNKLNLNNNPQSNLIIVTEVDGKEENITYFTSETDFINTYQTIVGMYNVEFKKQLELLRSSN